VKIQVANSAVEDDPEPGSDSDSSTSSVEGDDIPSHAAPKAAVPANKKPKALTGSLQIPKSLEVTLFDRLERMYGPDIKRMLTVQYRYVMTFKWSCNFFL